ncbi:hypothetical protein [Nocardioides daeguensis]|uniref:Cardiolipin synthase N-terminal domain-containing protein n=1 Tax=Nocardioides daeguensis TaxID=908359 RepID=A0ABP6VMA8_9ACTN|nr:hypothetical protein [Nocardioides daeguensis]MBV6727527.1 hypothetical protein [Nocardioides daeguensis]MCR1773251.1 hypothetical protein [Nocardioides daeguensis]
MPFWSLRPDTTLDWALWTLGAAFVVLTVMVIARDTRGRKVTGWDGLAVAFVVLGGPGAAFLFLSVYWVLAGRADRRARRARLSPRDGGA